VEAELAGRGRVLIRYSGTERKARVMVEGEDESRVRAYADELAATLRRALAGGR
jgi:phosphoglucosamine mutase